MRALYLLAFIAVILFLIAQIRVGVRAEYSVRGFLAWLRVGPLSVKIFPAKEKKKKKTRKKKAAEVKPEKPKPKKPKPEEAKQEQVQEKEEISAERTEGKKEEKAKEKPSAEGKEAEKTKPVTEKIGGAIDYAFALLPIALDAAGQFGKKLRIDVLRMELTAGAEDPADAAERYGQAVALLGALWTPLTQAFRVKDGEARVLADFECPGMSVYGTAALSLKLGQIIRLGLYFGLKGLFAFLDVNRKRKKEKLQQNSVKE